MRVCSLGWLVGWSVKWGLVVTCNVVMYDVVKV